MTYRRWDIILVPFPFTNLSTNKKRPALVISPVDYNKGLDVIIMFITSNLRVFGRPGDYKLTKWKEAGLLFTANIYCNPAYQKLRFFPLSHIFKHFSKLNRFTVFTKRRLKLNRVVFITFDEFGGQFIDNLFLDDVCSKA